MATWSLLTRAGESIVYLMEPGSPNVLWEVVAMSSDACGDREQYPLSLSTPTIRLPVGVSRFINRVTGYVETAPTVPRVAGTRVIKLAAANDYPRPSSDGFKGVSARVRIDAWTQEGETGQGPVDPGRHTVIEFDVKELDPERAVVVGTCRELALRAYFLRMLVSLTDDWPDADNTISLYLLAVGRQAKAEKWVDEQAVMQILDGRLQRAEDVLKSNPELRERVSAQFAIALFFRLKRLLETALTGDIIVMSEGIDYLYVLIRRAFLRILDETPDLAQLRDALPEDALPESLHSLGPDGWDVAWEFSVEPSITSYTGAILSFCAERGIHPWDDHVIDAVLSNYDEAIARYAEEKRKQTKAFWSRIERVERQRSGQADSHTGVATTATRDGATTSAAPSSIVDSGSARSVQGPVTPSMVRPKRIRRGVLGAYDREAMTEAYKKLWEELEERPDQSTFAAELGVCVRTIQRRLKILGMDWPPI